MVNIDILARAIHRAYGLQADLRRVAGENENYELASTDGRRYVLKLASRETTRERIELEHEAIEALHAAGAGVALPRLVASAAGDVVSRFDLGGGAECLARLLEFVPGEPWHGCAPASSELLRSLGRLTAAIGATLQPLDRRAARVTHRWDLLHAGGHRRAIAMIEDRDRRLAADEAFERWGAAAPDLGALPRGLIHGDLNDENLLVADGRLVGVIDFGDMLHNPLVADLAIALTYALLHQPAPWDAGAEIVAGYHAVRPLSAAEVEVLYPLITARLAVSLVVAANRRLEDPEREAWFVTEERAAAFLMKHGRHDPVTIADALARDIDVQPYPDRGVSAADLLPRRHAHVSRSLSLSYREPIKFMRGRGAYLIDERGRAYLDLYNNVAHVGHCHPHVVAAGAEQMARLNTNTRYLTDAQVAYSERLAATLPAELPVIFLLNSGTEANELALRLARCHTGNRDVLVLDNAYHGHTQGLIDVSPYKFMGRGGRGRSEPWVHVAPMPDTFRGPHRTLPATEQAAAYANEAAAIVADLEHPPAAFMAETLPSCGGQIIPPPGYLSAVAGHVRAAGGLLILDEVQVGLGRVGQAFWAFETQEVVPDIVVMGKPIGNGHPLAAVACTRAVAASFEDNGMEFFSTFGGNPVSCAIGSAVLDVIAAEGLQEHAREVGAHALAKLRELHGAQPSGRAGIGDVRGMGLFLGIEMVEADGLTPATGLAKDVINALRDERILTGTDGPYDNVIKIKGPLVVTAEDFDRFVRVLAEVLPD